MYVFNAKTRRNRGDGALLESKLFEPPGGGGGGGGGAAQPSPRRIIVNQVWHQFELTNSSGYPWTTGTALIMRDALSLGQELLIYTPPGDKTMLPVTVSLDLRGTINEQEIGRAGDPVHANGGTYHPLQKKGIITLSSFRREKAAVHIALSLGGKVTAASDGGDVRLDNNHPDDWDDGGASVNNHSDVAWDVSVEPGKSVTVTYEVSFYTR